MTTPIIVPVVTHPSRCPSCKQLENIKEVCANCGYEYEDVKTKWWKITLIATGITVGTVLLLIGGAVGMIKFLFPLIDKLVE